MTNRAKWIAAAVAVLAVLVILVWMFAGSGKDEGDEAEKVTSAPMKISHTSSGQVVVELAPNEQARIGLETEVLTAVTQTPLNYKRGYGAGVENTLSYNLPNLSLRLNVFVSREEDIGVATGQYNFDPLTLAYLNRHYFVLDHTPLVGGSGGVAYRWRDYQFTFDGLFSSGLRGGFANQEQLPKVWQFNVSASRFFHIPKLGQVENRIILLNMFDRINLIWPAKGIGVFQAAYGPRITVYYALTVPLPSF